MKKYDGVVQWIRMVDVGDEEDPIVVEQVDDITREVNDLIVRAEQAENERDAARKELADFRNKGHWTDIQVVRDDRTGLAAIVRTDYRLRAESMRLEWDPRYGGLLSAQTLAE